jgi:hypothetical protein
MATEDEHRVKAADISAQARRPTRILASRAKKISEIT